MNVLPGHEGGGSLQPSDVIGHVLPALMGRVGEDLVADSQEGVLCSQGKKLSCITTIRFSGNK